MIQYRRAMFSLSKHVYRTTDIQNLVFKMLTIICQTCMFTYNCLRDLIERSVLPLDYISGFSNHGTIIRIGITCKKIPCYMRDAACMWFIVKKTKIF